MSSHAQARVRIALLLAVGIFLQTTFAADLRVGGVAPDFMLLLTVCAGLAGGASQGALVGFFAGLLTDLFLAGTPVGLSALAFCLTGSLVGAFRSNLLPGGRAITVAMAFLGTAAGVVIFLAVSDLVGGQHVAVFGQAWILRVILGEAIWAAVLSLPVSWLFVRASRGSAGADRLAPGRADAVPTR